MTILFALRRFLRFRLVVLPVIVIALAGCAAKPPAVDNSAKEEATKKMSDLGLSSKKDFNKVD